MPNPHVDREHYDARQMIAQVQFAADVAMYDFRETGEWPDDAMGRVLAAHLDGPFKIRVALSDGTVLSETMPVDVIPNPKED